MLARGDGPLTMSSREIADVVEKRHDNVKRTIESLAKDGVIVHPQIEDEQDLDAMGRARTTSVYRLDKRSSFIVVAQLSPEFTARLVDRWQELEAGISERPALPDLSDPKVLTVLLLEHASKRIEAEKRAAAAEAQIEAVKPDMDAYARIGRAEGSLCLTDAAKALQLRPKEFFDFLRFNGWIYKRPGSAHWLGYQPKVIAGLLEHKVTTVLRPDGTEKIVEQVRITPKGLSVLAKLLPPRLQIA